MTIAIQLPPETENKLRQLAAQAGQSVDCFVARLVDAQAQPVQAKPETNGTTGEADDAEQERPWRGVFAPPRPRRTMFLQGASPLPTTLPKRKSVLNMEWHRTELDDA